MEKKRRRRLIALAVAIIVVIIVAVTVTVVLVTKDDPQNPTTSSPEVTTPDPEIPNPNDPPPPSWSDYALYQNAAISCDANCSYIGEDILQKDGNVAEAAIAMLLCIGVLHSQSMGIGGGFLMVIYNATDNSSDILNAREIAPSAATQDMFNGNSSLSQKGGLAVGVPGEIKGYWELFQKKGSGKVSWKELFEPTIKICEEGFAVDNHTANALLQNRDWILSTPSMAEIFVDPNTKDIFQLGDIVKRPQLAKTLRIIADSPNGGDVLYDAEEELTQWFVEDLNEFGGIITTEDMENYQVNWTEPIKVDIEGGFTLHTVPPPGSGALSAFMLRILSKVGLSNGTLATPEESVKAYHLITEAMKHAYAQRTKLGDPEDPTVADQVEELVFNLTMSEEFLESVVQLVEQDATNNTVEYYGAEYYTPDDHGTAHMSVVSKNGDAIAVTSTVNLYFGAGIRSNRTGIIYNDEMDDFSAPNITNAFGVPPSPNNFIKPGKRPLSSMCPSIYTYGDGQVRLAVGTAGGTKITTTTTYVAIRNLWFNETIKEAVDARRIHHQLFPMELQYEFGFIEPWVQGLKDIGHNATRFAIGSSVANGVARFENGTLSANWDFRKPGSIGGY